MSHQIDFTRGGSVTFCHLPLPHTCLPPATLPYCTPHTHARTRGEAGRASRAHGMRALYSMRHAFHNFRPALPYAPLPALRACLPRPCRACRARALRIPFPSPNSSGLVTVAFRQAFTACGGEPGFVDGLGSGSYPLRHSI